MIEIRPHHGMCIGQFEGKGYSEEFVANMVQVIQVLELNNPIIRLVCKADVICAKCPHNHCGECVSGQKVNNYDEICLSVCGFSENQELNWSDYQEKVKSKILDLGKIEQVCIGCCWLDICKNRIE